MDDLLGRLVASGTPADLVGEVAMMMARAERDRVELDGYRAAKEASRQRETERKREQRAELKGFQVPSSPTKSQGIAGTSGDSTGLAGTDPSLEKEGPHTPKKTQPSPSSLRSEIQRAREDLFAEFWSAYPKRIGANPKQPAQERFCRLLKNAVDPAALAQAIIDGARAYAASVANDDPRFVAQAVTWLNQRRWADEHVPPSDGPKANGARAGPHAKPSAVGLWTEDIFPDEQHHNPSAQTDRPALAHRG